MIAAKKMLYHAWLLKDQDMELKAFEHLAQIYFYKQNVERAEYYQNRVTRGLVEQEKSAPRVTCIKIRQLKKSLKTDTKPLHAFGKFSINQGVEIHDYTLSKEAYDRIRLLTVKSFSLPKESVEAERRVGPMLVRVATPLNNITNGEIPSPSNLKRDQKVLATVTLQQIQDPFGNVFQTPQTTDRNPLELTYLQVKEHERELSLNRRNARNERVILNKMMHLDNAKTDYLRASREDRTSLEAKCMGPLNYETIVKPIISKTKDKVKSTIYLTHIDPNKGKPSLEQTKRLGKVAWRKHCERVAVQKEMAAQATQIVRYLIRIRA